MPGEFNTIIFFFNANPDLDLTCNSVPFGISTKKPVFIRTEEQRIPQPPQLARKPQPVFESNPPADKPTSPLDKGEVKKEDNKMDYDKLFGDGIV